MDMAQLSNTLLQIFYIMIDYNVVLQWYLP